MIKYKVAWVFSTETWGVQRLSKHYYALELCNFAEEVYFFNPFSYGFIPKVELEAVPENKKLKIVNYSYLNKGKRFIPEMIGLLILGWNLKFLMKKTKSKPEIVFSFNHLDILSFKPLQSRHNVFLMYDLIFQNTTLPRLGLTADIMVTITSNIAGMLAKYNKPVLLLQHGLNVYFEKYALGNLQKADQYKAKCYPENILFIGSLFKGSLDRVSFRAIIEKYPLITFHFFGAFEFNENNLGGLTFNESKSFIDFLKKTKNVVLYGSQLSSSIVDKLDIIDCCLNIEVYERSKVDVSNAHKLIEYLAIGKPIFSTMVDEKVFPGELLFISKNDVKEDFNYFIQQFSNQSSHKKYLERINYSLSNTYFNNLKLIIESVNKI
jgi:hypothetical protein